MPIPRKVQIAEGIEIWHADFRDVILYDIGDVHHIVTDCPYEQRSHDTSGSIKRTDGQPNPEAIPFAGIDQMRDDLLIRARMKCSGWLICFCTTEGVAIWRDAIEANKLRYKTPMIWVKPDAMPKFNGQGPSHGHECMVSAWCGPGHSRWNGGGRRGVFTHLVNPFNRDGRHPTEKPLSLMMELVSLFTSPGEIVCDPFMGSGTTGVACVKLGRRFVGIECNEKYFQIAKERIAEALAQPDMFVANPKPIQEVMHELTQSVDSK